MVFRKITKQLLFLASLLCFSISISAQDGDPEAGKTLFRNNCAACHAKDMKTDLTGPALGGTQERWAEYPKEDLYRWIRQSQAMISEGHPHAVELWQKWKPTIMNNFPGLSDEDIANILAYIKAVEDGEMGPKPAAPTEVAVEEVKAPDNTWLFVTIAIVLAILAIVLARIVSNLDYLAKAKEGQAPPSRKSLQDILTSKAVIGFVLFALVVIGGYITVVKAVELGRQQNYQPEQPIKFSHKIHAGLNKIDCQYCHDGARRSKHSVIPAANTCMNCHEAIKVGSTHGTAELTKIFASIGYNPISNSYIENYEAMSRDSIELIFKQWIMDNQVEELGAMDQEAVDAEWDGIVSALTSEDDPKIQGPIEWIRIHNLPDHVYFNHAQHVSVGKIECQQCHGKIEEMEVVAQYSPLSMGWCVNCHRQTEVQFTNNKYYDNYYEKYHEEMAAGTRDKVTVEDIGGIGCQQCHY